MPKQAQPDQTLAHLSAAMFLCVCGLNWAAQLVVAQSCELLLIKQKNVP